ncbi:MAG: hypothetical protein JXB45_07465, partial [Candidatus Krumholzibacteriota bacterium]|nr:hypothetical protein [Candidatus Krumholzibacteriota bacterium]
MHWGNVKLLSLLWLLPAIALLLFWAAHKRRRALEIFVEAGLLERISLSVNPAGRRFKAVLTMLGLIFIVLA